ncbi:terminase large subunit domain-containing protein [Escherichia coli]|uniref:terminase large subunit domain-containing protein n=1 Tax=Escherichia coli TaxID=562 RepID=UPI0038B276B0
MVDDLAALEAMITPEMLLKMPPDEQTAFITNFYDYIKYRKYNQIEFMEPYGYQKLFMEKSAEYDARFLRAGNRVGKTWCGALEMAYHITGRYPPFWKGKRIEGSGRLFWCIGKTLDMVRDIQQRHVLGTADATRTEELGTGTIPRECIEIDRGMKRDGQRVENCAIRHVDGGLNTLVFYGSSDEGSNIMGREVSLIWIDEESPYSTKVFSQCQARTINALGLDNDGLIYITATPEEGNTALNQMFEKNADGSLYLQQVTWWDVPERFTPNKIAQRLAKYPEWERDMRSKGLPCVGKGAVFPFDDKDVEIHDFEIKPAPHWKEILACDLGHIKDPSVIIHAYLDPDTNQKIVAQEWILDQDEEARSARGIARVILNSPFRNVPLQVPVDGGRNSDATEAVAKLLIEYGVNVIPSTFRNPSDYDLDFEYSKKGNNPRQIEPGLAIMRDLVSKGQLKVSNACGEWFKEKHVYSYKYNERTQTLGYAGADHCIDASRYAIMSLIDGRGSYVYERDNNHKHAYTALNINL